MTTAHRLADLSEVEEVYLGEVAVDAMYLGDEQVYPPEEPEEP